MLSRLEKKQLKIFIIVAYGITFLMGGLMAYGNGRQLDVSAFPNAQMMYPAADSPQRQGHHRSVQG